MIYKQLETAIAAADTKASKYGGQFKVMAWYSGGFIVDRAATVNPADTLYTTS